MNPHKYFVSAELINNPLCGISTYKDILNLATGQITRNIKKLVLTGEESWTYESTYSRFSTFNILPVSFGARATPMFCSHFQAVDDGRALANVPDNSCYSGAVGSSGIYFKTESYTSVEDFKAYLTQQYENEMPITLWIILASPETAQITVPSGLSGTVEGYLIQDGTPTPAAPIYPTANTAKGWYNINAYKRSVLVWNTDTAYERSDGSWT